MFWPLPFFARGQEAGLCLAVVAVPLPLAAGSSGAFSVLAPFEGQKQASTETQMLV